MNWLKWKQWFLDWWLLLVPAVFALGAITAYSIIFRSVPATENPAAWGSFGDFIGGLMNPLVSVLTLFVAISVWKLQKAELELTRNEMAQTKEAMEDQAKTAEQQRRQQRFFDLFNVYQQTLASISLTANASNSAIELSGRRALSHILFRGAGLLNPNTRRLFTNEGLVLPQWNPSSQECKITADWELIGPLVDHYFRVLFTILREAEPILESEHYRYIKMLRAQLSSGELTFIAMNALYDLEGRKMRELIAKYGLLKHLPACHLRTIAEKELPLKSFGHQWASNHLLNSTALNYHAP